MGKASRAKRERKQGQTAALRDLHARVESHRGSDRLPEWGEPGDGPNLSESLVELIRPYTAPGMDEAARRTLVRAGVLAWNRTLPSQEIPGGQLEKIIASEHPEAREQVRRCIEEMSERKRRLFPNDLRFIVDAELREQNNGTFYLAVTMVEDEEDGGGDEETENGTP